MRRRVLLRGSMAAGAGLTGAGAMAAPAGAARSSALPLRVQMVLFDGVVGTDFVAPHDVFSIAGALSAGSLRLSCVRVEGPGTARLGGGMQVEVEKPWAPDQADIIVVPGSGLGGDGPGVRAEIARGVLPRALGAARRRGLTMASVCTGALLLGAAGLVRGRPCVTHRTASSQLEAQGGVIKDARVVDDGDLVTAGGITSGLDLALWLVRRELGADLALAVETVFEYEARGTVWTSEPRAS